MLVSYLRFFFYFTKVPAHILDKKREKKRNLNIVKMLGFIESIEFLVNTE